jgi:hypothetical protein
LTLARVPNHRKRPRNEGLCAAVFKARLQAVNQAAENVCDSKRSRIFSTLIESSLL